MDKPNFLHLREKITKYQPSEATQLVIGGATLLLALGPLALAKTNFIEDRGARLVRPRTTRDIQPGELFQPAGDFDQISEAINAGDFVTVSIDDSGNFTGTTVEDFPDGEISALVSSTTEVDSFSNLGFKKLVPVYLMPASKEALVDAIKSKSPSLDATRQQLSRARNSLAASLEQQNLRFVVLGDPIAAAQDLKDAIVGNPETQRHVEYARALGRSIIRQLSR